MLTVSEVENAIEGHIFVSEGEYRGQPYRHENSGWDCWDDMVPGSEDRKSEPVEVPELGSVRMLHTYTGGEGGGENCEMIFEITSPDGSVRWFRMNGYYASYDGTTWDGTFNEVKPREKTVTVYE